MFDEEQFRQGQIAEWQTIHRSTRLRIYPHLLHQRIIYRTYFLRDNNLPMERLRVLDVIEIRTRGFGKDRAFVGINERGELLEIPWSRIVEVGLDTGNTEAGKD